MLESLNQRARSRLANTFEFDPKTHVWDALDEYESTMNTHVRTILRELGAPYEPRMMTGPPPIVTPKTAA